MIHLTCRQVDVILQYIEGAREGLKSGDIGEAGFHLGRLYEGMCRIALEGRREGEE